jgi:NitT/TauT family transport system substrate-binding protein
MAAAAALVTGCGSTAPAASPASSAAGTAAPVSAKAAGTTASSGAPASPSAKPSASAGTSAGAAASAKPAPSGAAAASAAAKPGAYSPVPLSPAVKVPFGDNTTLGTAPIFIAYDRGYFKAEGLDVELIPTPTIPQIIQALAASQISFATANPDPALFNALDRGLDIKLLTSLVTNKPGDKPAAFLVRKDLIDSGKYKSPKDLKGLKVGMPAAQSQFYVDRFLGQDGLTAADVDLQNVSLPDMVAAFANKGIDAAWCTEPFNTVIEKQGLAKIVAVTGDLFPGAVGVTLAVSPGFAKAQPEPTQRFVNAFLRGLRDYHHAFFKKDIDKGPMVQALINHTPVKDPALYDQIGLGGVDPNGRLDAQTLATWDVLQDYFVKINLQPKKIDLSKYLDQTYLNKAVEMLGREQA